MPQTQSAVRGVYDFSAPSVEGVTDIGFRVRNNRGGKVQLRFENPITNTGADNASFNPNEAKDMTVSVQVAPALASGLPGTFVATTAAANLEAVTDEVVGPGQFKDFTILLRPGLDVFVLVTSSGGTRGQLIVTGDDLWDRWRTEDGLVDLTAV